LWLPVLCGASILFVSPGEPADSNTDTDNDMTTERADFLALQIIAQTERTFDAEFSATNTSSETLHEIADVYHNNVELFIGWGCSVAVITLALDYAAEVQNMAFVMAT